MADEALDGKSPTAAVGERRRRRERALGQRTQKGEQYQSSAKDRHFIKIISRALRRSIIKISATTKELSKQSRHFAILPSTDDGNSAAAVTADGRTDDRTDGRRLCTPRWWRAAAATAVPSCCQQWEQEQLFRHPSPAACQPACLPISLPPTPLPLSPNSPISIYYSICHVFAHPGLMWSSGRPAEGVWPQILTIELFPFPENKAETFRKVILRPSPVCLRLPVHRGGLTAADDTTAAVRVRESQNALSALLHDHALSAALAEPELFLEYTRWRQRRQSKASPSSTTTTHSFWPRMNYT